MVVSKSRVEGSKEFDALKVGSYCAAPMFKSRIASRRSSSKEGSC